MRTLPLHTIAWSIIGLLSACGNSTSGNKSDSGDAMSAGEGFGLDADWGFETIAVSSFPDGGNPSGSCSLTLPTEAQPADTSNPTTVVGTGTPASCTFAALDAAVTAGGVITFDCGANPVSIAVTSTLKFPTKSPSVVDGGNKIIMDGGGLVQIMRFDDHSWETNTNSLTLQNLTFINGKSVPTEPIPLAPAPCSQGWYDGQGGALYVGDGALRVIDCVFENNEAAQVGPDTGGGAIYIYGAKPAFIAGSTFINNTASNAGAVGVLDTELNVYNSYFTGNHATGSGANDIQPTECSVQDSNGYQVGSGGNGGALYSDGSALNVTICGTTITGNHAGAFGAALFFTSDNSSNLGTLTITDSTMTANVDDSPGWQWMPGISTNAATTTPVNSTITN